MRVRCLVAVTAALLILGLARAAAPASAAVPKETDIMFIFDTSGSMGPVLEEAKEEIEKVITETSAQLPNVEYGVANVEDLDGYLFGTLDEVLNKNDELVPQLTEAEYTELAEKPWRLDQTLTSEQAKVTEAIDGLSGYETVAHYGGDGPEAYGRALYETATNPEVKWRPGARHEIILIADQVPHTPNVNEGIPAEFWTENPFDTGEELPGKWGIPDTQWKEGESLEFHKTLQKLDAEEKPLAMVDYHDTEGDYIHYWEYWAAETGGQAVGVNELGKELGAKLTAVIKESAEGIPPCPPGYERGPTTPCIPKPAPVVTPPAPVAPPVFIPSTAPPVKGKVYVLVDGEVEEEIEFPEEGEFEDEGFIEEGASLASFQQDGLVQFGGQQLATIASKCKKGFVHKNGKCVSNKPVKFGHVHVKITKAGRYRIKIKPSKRVLLALKEGKTLHVKFKLVFTPAGTTDHIHSVRYVTVHLKKKHKKK